MICLLHILSKRDFNLKTIYLYYLSTSDLIHSRFQITQPIREDNFNVIPEFQNSSVKYSLESPTVSLDEVFFPSLTVCNMNLLRRSFVEAVLQDEEVKKLGVEYQELKKIIFSVFIFGGDYQASERDTEIIDGTNDQFHDSFQIIQ